MASINAMRTMFGRLGFTGQGPAMLTVDQGIDHIDDLKSLDADEIETLLKLLRRPGGTITNPNAANPGQPAHITAPGILVSMRAATHLKLAIYYCRHMKRTSRPLKSVGITCPTIKKLKSLRDKEDSHSEPTKNPIIDPKNWSKTLEAVQEWISLHLGINKAPFSYVTRVEIDPQPHTGNVAYELPDFVYLSPQEEMIARSPIRSTGIVVVYDNDFIIDNKAVWEVICKLCRDEGCWTHIKPFLKKKNGRGDFFALWTYYLGKANVDNQASASEKGLDLARWSGDTKRYTFNDYVTIHLNHHSVLNDLTSHGHSGIDERSKVRHLLKGIKTFKLDAVKTTILASDALRSDFGCCVTLYKDFQLQNEGVAGDDSRNISKVDVDDENEGEGGNNRNGRRSGGGRRKRGRDDEDERECEDRYYISEEYSKLSKANKNWLRLTRNKRVKMGGYRGNTAVGTDRAIAVLSNAVDELQMQDASQRMTVAEVGTNPNITTLAVAPPVVNAVTNTNNSALTRIATRQTI